MGLNAVEELGEMEIYDAYIANIADDNPLKEFLCRNPDASFRDCKTSRETTPEVLTQLKEQAEEYKKAQKAAKKKKGKKSKKRKARRARRARRRAKRRLPKRRRRPPKRLPRKLRRRPPRKRKQRSRGMSEHDPVHRSPGWSIWRIACVPAACGGRRHHRLYICY